MKDTKTVVIVGILIVIIALSVSLASYSVKIMNDKEKQNDLIIADMNVLTNRNLLNGLENKYYIENNQAHLVAKLYNENDSIIYNIVIKNIGIDIINIDESNIKFIKPSSNEYINYKVNLDETKKELEPNETTSIKVVASLNKKSTNEPYHLLETIVEIYS